MNRKPIIIANWKMNLSSSGLERFFSHFTIDDKDLDKVQTIFCPSFTLLSQVCSFISDRPLALGAQNVFWEERGAYTGEVSAQQLSDVGCQYVIVGHSERRRLFNEDDEMVNKKIQLVLKHKMIPVVCLGENFREKESGQTRKVIEQKLSVCLKDLRSFELKKIIISYEPIWAISTNPNNPDKLADSPEEAQVIHKFIRKTVGNMFDEHTARAFTVIYGGSVNPENIEGFAKMNDIDGVLVGGASREADKFQKIVGAYLN